MKRLKSVHAVDWILATAAILIVAKVYFPSSAEGIAKEAGDSVKVENKHWRAGVATSLKLGANAGRDTMVEFMDFECPYCRVFASQIDTLFAKGSASVTILVQHFPLPSHRFAEPAAIAAECADRQGKFAPMYRALFAKQDSLGLKDWVDFAHEAGVPDTVKFNSCRALPADSFPRIGAGVELGRAAAIGGTPTVWINGVSRKWKPAVVQVNKMLEKR